MKIRLLNSHNILISVINFPDINCTFLLLLFDSLSARVGLARLSYCLIWVASFASLLVNIEFSCLRYLRWMYIDRHDAVRMTSYSTIYRRPNFQNTRLEKYYWYIFNWFLCGGNFRRSPKWKPSEIKSRLRKDCSNTILVLDIKNNLKCNRTIYNFNEASY